MEFSKGLQLQFIFGLLGNIVSFMVFLAPLPTFWRIYKKKTSEGFQSIPYVVALLSSMLMLYYAFLKSNEYMLISINGIGCVIEAIYITIYLLYASTTDKVFTLKSVLICNVGAYGGMVAATLFLIHGPNRTNAVGWICSAFSLAVFAAPLSIMKKVVTTKSVEYMPFTLSFFLTLSAIIWFFYGFFVNDLFIALPNTVGFLLGLIQMIMYMIYRDKKVKINHNFDMEAVKFEEGGKTFEGDGPKEPTIPPQQ